MRKALELLARLERQELDHERQALRKVEAELAEAEHELGVLRDRRPHEHEAGWALPGGPGLLAAYLGAAGRREVGLADRLRELAVAQAHAQEAVRARIAAAKSLEIAARHLAAEATAAEERRAMLEIEEASGLRLGAGASVKTPVPG